MKKRYYPQPPRTAAGTWPVVDERTGAEVLQCGTETEALCRAATLNQAYEAFIEATAAWRDAGRPRIAA